MSYPVTHGTRYYSLYPLKTNLTFVTIKRLDGLNLAAP